MLLGCMHVSPGVAAIVHRRVRPRLFTYRAGSRLVENEVGQTNEWYASKISTSADLENLVFLLC